MKQHIAHMLREKASAYKTKEVFRYKDKISSVYKSISWSELINYTEKVSESLVQLGFGFNDKIGIFSSNRPEWTIADLGILSVRGIVVPFYATSSVQHVKYIVDETRMKLMFVGNSEQVEKALWLLENCKSLEKVVVFDNDVSQTDERCITWEYFLKISAENNHKESLNKLLEEAQPDDLATIIYTSGTTGESKGVMLGHDNFMSAFKINDERLKINDNDISLCFLPLSHVFERTWTYFLLYCGAINVFLENPRDVIQELPVVKPTLMCTVPRFYEKTYEGIYAETEKWPSFKKKIFNWSIRTGLESIEYKKDSRHLPLTLKVKLFIADKLVLAKLRQVFGGKIKFLPCAGAAIDSKLLRFFHATGIFINYGYGATETTATVSCFRSDKYNFDYCGSIMPETNVKIGENNEILVKGNTVFKGYYNKPEETNKVLKNGWYYTGDEGYIAEGDYLVMTDRIKDLIKTSGGKYVSPQKIELLLSQNKYIEQVVVLGDNKKYITALIVPSHHNLVVYAKEMDLNIDDNQQFIENALILDFFQKQIDECQKDLTPYEKVIKFALLPETFSIDNKLLTNTLKIRRKAIAEKYSDLIEKMYL
ncbi:MAG: hypothetical protein A2X13_10155 [Bacteroidetes bacterium GWC2_33_15]|nr:MAG: hypothetical protein A2X10_02710 [Bacteroidetes bacterium GWA2_33_15]OFX48769.1 MAG: hypothetical protein A2X13_10155 [Bacteroidetes bacterium GWC2_33_15]OFX66011.1 MAG: hypothetical protein A2X15_11305 [Bacteroidetes bacterium GWB2_32_14]OFX68228.1 MAG: hypothetical protein A2X14_07590 [Bacteroidetes bacterium GWD2_33_33]HAN18005.1 long-chain fatty acid--CoA ligase [Bacteroidales bacterium]